MKHEDNYMSNVDVMLEQFAQVEVPQDIQQRLNARIDEFCENPQPAMVTLPSTTTLGSRSWFVGATAAASVMFLAAAISFFALFSHQRAWAQVVEALAKHPWIRVTLQQPSGPLDGEPQAVTIWLRGNRSVAAIKSTQQNAWVDMNSGDQYELTKDAQRIILSKLNSSERHGIDHFLDSLAPFEVSLGSAFKESIKTTQTSKKEVTEHGVTYVDFEFEFSSVDTQDKESLTVRVDKDSKTPVQLRTHRAVFAIDYPDIGPNDIYALGIAVDTPVTDVRDLEKYVGPRSQVHDAYEAIEIGGLAGLEDRWINEAGRFRFANGIAQAEFADLKQVMELSHAVYFAGTDKPTGVTHRSDWWLDEAAKLNFVAQEWGEFNFPHTRCYQPIGSVRDYESAIPSQLQGLEETIELRGKNRSVWIDPNRDCVVRRNEYVEQDGSIPVTQIDQLVQDSKGHWYSTKWRSGRVLERGGLLPTEVNRDDATSVATTVHFARIEFK